MDSTADRLRLGGGPWASHRVESIAIGISAVGIVAVVFLGAALGYGEVDLWGAFLVPAVLSALTIPVLGRLQWLRVEGLVKLA